jgi:prefoldin subunit 5
MPAVFPPLDRIPNLPPQITDKAIQQLTKLVDQLGDKVVTVSKDSVKLPEKCNCDDPRIKKIKKDLTDVQGLITKLQTEIPKIQKIINTTKTVITAANGVKTALAAAQLSIPATAGLFVAMLLKDVQDATIKNAIASINQLAKVPPSLTAQLNKFTPTIQEALNKIGSSCNGEVPTISIPTSTLRDADALDSFGDEFDYNDLLDSEFYQEINVSQEDLTNRSENIQKLIEQQRSLLTLQEAPSQVYQQVGRPADDLGKTGDYYIDTQNLMIYGPKLSDTEWPSMGVNY